MKYRVLPDQTFRKFVAKNPLTYKFYIVPK